MNRRLGITLVAFVTWAAITVIGGHLRAGGTGPLDSMVTRGPGWPFIIASLFILGVVLWQDWRDVGLNRLPAARDLVLTWLPMLYVVIGLVVAAIFGLPPVAVLAWIMINTLFVGFSEELMFRGAILQAFRHVTTIWRAVLLTSVAFGAVHSLNVFVTGNLKNALIQSTAAFLSGLVFIALRLRTGSLWPSIITHGLWDFATFTLSLAVHDAAVGAAPPEPAGQGMVALKDLIPIAVVAPNAIYGLWLMRRIGQTHRHAEA